MKGRDRDHPVPDRHVFDPFVEYVHDFQVGRGRVPVARGGLADVWNGGRAATVHPMQYFLQPYANFLLPQNPVGLGFSRGVPAS